MLERFRPRVELGPLALELDPGRGELLLDPACLERTLLQPLPFGGCEPLLGLGLAAHRRRRLELPRKLPLALYDCFGLGLERCLPLPQLPLAGVEGLRPLERGPLACGDCLARSRVSGLASRWRRRGSVLQLGELPLAGGDRLRALSQRGLQRVELGAIALLLGVPLGRELACQAQQLLAVEVDARLVSLRIRRPRRPAVEAFLPAVYAASLRQQTLTM